MLEIHAVFIDKLLEQCPIETRQIKFEVTESLFVKETELVLNKLNALKQRGFQLSLDDFGTGYSSLSYLQKLPLDRLKVDRSFVTEIHLEGKSLIAETIINLGKKMNLKVIAEGIEEIEQQERLIELGCDEVQGFYYAKPLPSEEFLAFLENNQ